MKKTIVKDPRERYEENRIIKALNDQCFERYLAGHYKYKSLFDGEEPMLYKHVLFEIHKYYKNYPESNIDKLFVETLNKMATGQTQWIRKYDALYLAYTYVLYELEFEKNKITTFQIGKEDLTATLNTLREQVIFNKNNLKEESARYIKSKGCGYDVAIRERLEQISKYIN